MKFIVAEVRLSELTTVPVTVAPWEFQVLKAAHPDGCVTQKGVTEVERDAPDAADEFARLEAKYQTNGDSPSVAGQVYGLHEAGISALQKEITKAVRASKVVSVDETQATEQPAG